MHCKGDIILVNHGDKIAIDGEIIWGDATINESMFTGESGRVTLKDQVGATFGAVFTAIFINGHRVRPPAIKIEDLYSAKPLIWKEVDGGLEHPSERQAIDGT